MKNVVKVLIIFGFISIILGVLSRIAMTPFIVEAGAFLDFSLFCFISSIALILFDHVYNKK
ncbi:MAG: hypothetical protein JXQ65_08475 [Candidatus Marinimicrobia bacterium]|nr:hypothetical protein [Candidatus Neomarinimicrobiota bacterium]